MKKWNISIISVMLALLTIFSSCEEEALNTREKEPSADAPALSKNKDSNMRGGDSFCFYRPDKGRLMAYLDNSVFPPQFKLECYDVAEFCRLFYRPICVPLNPCQYIRCWEHEIFDPWELAKIVKPNEFGSLRDAAQIDPQPGFSSFPVNEHILGLQFYEKLPNITHQELRVRTTTEIDPKLASSYGLQGGVVPAGVYPVVYNQENNTFNALASVKNLPLKYDRQIVKITPEYFKGSLNSLFSSFKMEQRPNSMLIEPDIERFRIEPDLSRQFQGVYGFSSNKSDLNLIFYGEPNPQPNRYDPTPTPIKVWMEKPMWLDQQLAAYLGIAPFELKPENLYQTFDKEQNVLRVIIINAKAGY